MEYVFLEEESGQRISLEPLSAETAEDCGHHSFFLFARKDKITNNQDSYGKAQKTKKITMKTS